MILKAIKLHSMASDYVVIDISQFAFTEDQLSALAMQLCKRRGPVGCNGVAYIRSRDQASATVDVMKPSGSESKLCINGLHCAARYILDTRKQFPSLRIPTPFGSVEASFGDDLDINVPSVDILLPFVPTSGIDSNSMVSSPLHDSISMEGLQFHPVQLGDPHLVTICEPLADSLLGKLGAVLQLDRRFPTGINVSVASMLGDKRVFVRTFERSGAGLTQSCSSGILAAVWVLVSQGRLARGEAISCFNLGGRASVLIGEGFSRLLSNVSTAFRAEFKIQPSPMLLEPAFSGAFHYEEAVAYHKWCDEIFAENSLAMIQKTVAQ